MGCHSATHNVISRLLHLNQKLSNFGRCECMKLGTTVTEIISIDSQFIIFHVCDICKVSDKLSDFESGELYDMLLQLPPFTY
jgi:hypothetical protein